MTGSGGRGGTNRTLCTGAQDAGKDIETLYFDDEGHWDYHWTNNVIRARRVEDFLAKHLGGRSDGWDLIETALPYLK